ncbi:MAG: hypothetical protein IT425_14560 [Pirellulales bacterium]|nr:hypothetical protein [Pirellulales bacterium]
MKSTPSQGAEGPPAGDSSSAPPASDPQPAATLPEPAAEPASTASNPKVEADAVRTPAKLGEGAMVRVRLPLKGLADEDAKSAIQRVVERLLASPSSDGRRPTLVLELCPQSSEAEFGRGTDFTRALSLADFLTRPEMSAVKTVAHVPRTIKGHGVLIALACDQIAIHPDAELGEAGIDEDSRRAIDSKRRAAYVSVVKAKHSVPLAVALGMVDRQLEVLQVETDAGIEYALRDDLPELAKKHTIIAENTIVPAGSLGTFSGREGREFGLLQIRDTESLARSLGLPASVVSLDQSMQGNWRPVVLRIEGPITHRKARQFSTLLGVELSKRKTNWIAVTINSAGGSLGDCLDMAATLAQLDSDEVHTVAYVPVEAAGGAGIIALACDQVVLQPEAHLGGKVLGPEDPETLGTAKKQIQESLAKHLPHGWSLPMAMIDPSIELYAYQNVSTGEVRYLSAEEAGALEEAAKWRRGARFKPANESLILPSAQAREMGFAHQIVNSFDELRQLYVIRQEVREAKPNWALELIEALATPGLAILLLLIGFIGVYIELHSPGIGAGGFIAALAFLLFFWSKFLDGTAEWLEVLLFLTGVFFLLVELLLLPGFGIFGLGGGAMILASLVLASQTFVFPHTESQMVELRRSLMVVAAAGLGLMIAGFSLRRYLPQAPGFRRLLLQPMPEEDLADLDYREAIADYSNLVGEQGEAFTNLMPAGKAVFSGQLIDVIAEGLPIDRGRTVVVVKTRGNRVVVRALENPSG